MLPGLVLSNDLPPKKELCPNNDCRGPITIKLMKEDGLVFEQKYEYFYPIIQPIGITILAGEEVQITGDFENDLLKNIYVPDEPEYGAAIGAALVAAERA